MVPLSTSRKRPSPHPIIPNNPSKRRPSYHHHHQPQYDDRSSTASSSSSSSSTTSSSSSSSSFSNRLNSSIYSSPASSTVSIYENKKQSNEERRRKLLEREIRMLFELEYQEEVVDYMHLMDQNTRATVETIDLQPELEWYMRPYLIDFLIEIHQQYRLRPETLHLTINLIDRYVSKRIVFKKHYQLVGCTSLWIASKYEDSKEKVMSVSELKKMCCDAYEENSFIQMEGHILSTLDWNLSFPSQEAWIRVYSIGAHLKKSSSSSSSEGEEEEEQHGRRRRRREEDREEIMIRLESGLVGHLTRFLGEITLFYRSFVGILGSEVAMGCLILSRYILGHPSREDEETPGAIEMAKRLNELLIDPSTDRFNPSISKIVFKKYSFGYYSRAALIVKEWYDSGRRYLILNGSSSDHHQKRWGDQEEEEEERGLKKTDVGIQGLSIGNQTSDHKIHQEGDKENQPLLPVSTEMIRL